MASANLTQGNNNASKSSKIFIRSQSRFTFNWNDPFTIVDNKSKVMRVEEAIQQRRLRLAQSQQKKQLHSGGFVIN